MIMENAEGGSAGSRLLPEVLGRLPSVSTGEKQGSSSFLIPPKNELVRKKLFLHFDVNETILVGDEAGSDTRQDSINKMIAKSAFVKIPESFGGDTHSYQPTNWMDGTPIELKPESAVPLQEDESQQIPPLYTGWEWPSGTCPYYRTKLKKTAKIFTDNYGYMFKPLYNHLNASVQSSNPKAAEEFPVLSHMLPAFFDTIVALKETEQSFVLIFRTFGTDLPEIAEAVTAFANGKHPDYPFFHAPGLVLQKASLYQGKWRRLSESDPEEVVYELWQDEKRIASGDDEVLEVIRKLSICGIQDDYPFWSSHDCRPQAGKPVWKTLPGSNEHHILFDDNIHNLEFDSIAAVREQLPSGGFRSLEGNEIQKEHGFHLIRVPTIEPILNRGWFCEQIRFATKNFAARQLP